MVNMVKNKNGYSNRITHPDDIAVNLFCTAMKEKLDQCGYSGWDDQDRCSMEDLIFSLIGHIKKGDFVDVGNFAMMIWNREQMLKRSIEKELDKS